MRSQHHHLECTVLEFEISFGVSAIWIKCHGSLDLKENHRIGHRHHLILRERCHFDLLALNITLSLSLSPPSPHPLRLNSSFLNMTRACAGGSRKLWGRKEVVHPTPPPPLLPHAPLTQFPTYCTESKRGAAASRTTRMHYLTPVDLP
ncbi:hypothetical protein Pcinc_024520 [Petrolisthes cinctipes]|uniref:Uncharacterized protein n=1 Tax=Petrolisthes cinctipes TaxID=88211 RepID=A0AAE1FAS3_PETCI|nr:hypothetical protein Pcinc_024520 [Petrolisthes cinctipes]